MKLVYIALDATFSPQEQSTEISILDDFEKPPILIDFNCFDIIDSWIPENWCFLNLGESYYRLTPQEFGGNFRMNFMIVRLKMGVFLQVFFKLIMYWVIKFE